MYYVIIQLRLSNMILILKECTILESFQALATPESLNYVAYGG